MVNINSDTREILNDMDNVELALLEKSKLINDIIGFYKILLDKMLNEFHIYSCKHLIKE